MQKKIYISHDEDENFYDAHTDLSTVERGDEVYEVKLPRKVRYVEANTTYKLVDKKPEYDPWAF